MADKIFVGRKNAVARVILRNGSGKVTINNREFENFFRLRIIETMLLHNLKLPKL